MSGLRCALVWLDLEFSFSFNSSQSCVVFLKEAFKAAFITINSNPKAATDDFFWKNARVQWQVAITMIQADETKQF